MRPRTFFITGTDTGVGKTVLTALLIKYLREQGVNAAALKPICSGGRNDAQVLHAASKNALTLDEINPWTFRAPIAPVLAARRQKKRLVLSQVLTHARAVQKRFDILLIEGAGGLLSPLGEHFDSHDMIASLHATPIIVCPNRIGAVNQVLLTLKALPRFAAAKTRVVLMSPQKPDASTGTNPDLIAEHFDGKRIFMLPRLPVQSVLTRPLRNVRVNRILRALVLKR